MSEPTSPEAEALGPPERLHPLFLLTGLGGSLRGLAGGYAGIGYLAVSGRLSTAIIGLVALLIFMAVGIVLYWTRFEFRVGANEIRIDSGIVSRTHRSIPFERIQDVDITQGPIARLLGLAQVKFETGGSGGEEEGVLHAITLQRAQEIRELVRSRRPSALAPLAAAQEERPPVYAMDLRRLALAGTFNFSLAVFAGLFGVTQTYGDVVGFDPLSRRFWTGLLSPENPVAAYVLQHRVAAAVAGALLLVLIGLLTGIVRTLLRDYGFRLDRTDVGLRRRRGLLTRTDVTLPVKRAQAVVLRSGPLREAFGWREVTLQSLARDEGERGDHVLAPLASAEEANGIIAELGWRPLVGELAWNRLSRAYVWTFVIALAPFMILLGLQLLVLAATPLVLDPTLRGPVFRQFAPLLVPTAIILLGLLLAVLARALAWRRTAYALDGDRLLTRSGWWRRRLTILPLAKIQSVDLTENFIGRWFGIAALRFGVAGGGAGGHIIPAIPSATARQLRKELLGSAA